MQKLLGMLAFGAVLMFGFGGCGEDEKTVCDEAWDLWCACPSVSCEGSPSSCSGPDKEWAECILAAADACDSNCR